LLTAVALLAPLRPHPPAPCPSVPACRSELAHARRAIAWQRHARRSLARHLRAVHRPIVVEAAELAARAFGIDAGAMIRVASCETGGTFDPYARNPSSGALGPWQFLPSTWRSTPFARWSPTNPFASALAAAQVVWADGGWSQWSCKP
jgi:hypothetical protein